MLAAQPFITGMLLVLLLSAAQLHATLALCFSQPAACTKGLWAGRQAGGLAAEACQGQRSAVPTRPTPSSLHPPWPLPLWPADPTQLCRWLFAGSVRESVALEAGVSCDLNAHLSGSLLESLLEDKQGEGFACLNGDPGDLLAS